MTHFWEEVEDVVRRRDRGVILNLLKRSVAVRVRVRPSGDGLPIHQREVCTPPVERSRE
jgi:hypothetical protein